MINLVNSVNSNEIPENENLTKIVKIVEKILDFSKQQKGKGHTLDLAHIALMAKVFNRKVFDLTQIEISLLSKCFKDY